MELKCKLCQEIFDDYWEIVKHLISYQHDLIVYTAILDEFTEEISLETKNLFTN